MFGSAWLTIIDAHGPLPARQDAPIMTQTPFARSARRLAVLLTAGAVGLIGLSLARPPPGLGSAAFAANEQQAPGQTASDAYDLTDVRMLRQVVVYIKDNYVDPDFFEKAL